MIVERMRNDQTGIENKHLKWYQVKEALLDYKLYILFGQGVLCMCDFCSLDLKYGYEMKANYIFVRQHSEWWFQQLWHNHYQGIWLFNTGDDTSTGMPSPIQHTSRTVSSHILDQIPYGVSICLAQLSCVFLNSKFQNRRVFFVILYLIPTLAAGFGMRYVPLDQKVGRLICYYLTAFYPGAWVLVLSMIIANVSGKLDLVPLLFSRTQRTLTQPGHSKKIVMNIGFFLGYSSGNLAGPFFYRSQDE